MDGTRGASRFLQSIAALSVIPRRWRGARSRTVCGRVMKTPVSRTGRDDALKPSPKRGNGDIGAADATCPRSRTTCSSPLSADKNICRYAAKGNSTTASMKSLTVAVPLRLQVEKRGHYLGNGATVRRYDARYSSDSAIRTRIRTA